MPPGGGADVFGPALGVALCAPLLLALAWIFQTRGYGRLLNRIGPFLVVFLLLVSATDLGKLPSNSATAATGLGSATEVAKYQSDFAHGYTTGWFVQPGTNALATVGIVSDNGTNVLGASAHNAQGALVFYNGGEDWQSQNVTATIKGINGSSFDFLFLHQLVVSSQSWYEVHFDLVAQVASLVKAVGSGPSPPVMTTLSSTNLAFGLNTWYTVGVGVSGGSFQVSFNGARILSATDPSPLTYGTVAFDSETVYGSYRVGTVSVTALVPAQSTWQQLGGPDGGQIQAIDINPSNTSIIYAGAVHTGVLKSDNRGDYWREVGYANGMTGTKANVVVVAPSNASIVYASLEDSSTGGGAYRTDDAGAHWRALSQGLSGYFINAMAVDPTDPNVLYFSTENNPGSALSVGLQKSADGGNTYRTILTAQVDAIAISKTNPNTVYVGTLDRGVLRSDDGGASWRNVTPSQFQGQPINRVIIDPGNPAISIAHTGVINLGGRTCGVGLRSTDGGNTWTNFIGSMPYFGPKPCSPYGGLTDLAQSLSNPSILYAIASYPNGTGTYFRSDDSGTTWRQLNGRMAAAPEVVRIDPTNPNIVYIGTFGEGIYRTTDGGLTLVHLTTGSPAGGVYALAVYPGNSNIVFASRSINGFGEVANSLGTLSVSSDGGITWKDFDGPPFNIVDIRIDPTTPSTMYVATSGSPVAVGTGLWKSTDGGATWVQRNQGLTFPNLTSIAINPSNTNMLLVGTGHRPYGGQVFGQSAGGGIFKTTDGGDTWHKVNIPNFMINQVVINPASPNVAYAATFGGGVYKSTDAGENWFQANSGIGSTSVYTLAVNPSQPDTLYAGVNPFYAQSQAPGAPQIPETDNAVYKTTNGAVSWSLVFLDHDVEWILIDPGNYQSVYEGNHGGYISWSTDGGATWSYGAEVIRKIGGHAYMWAATTDPGRRALLVGTCGRGAFINRLATAEVPTPAWLKVPFNQNYFSATFFSNSSLLDFSFKPAVPSFVFTVSGAAGSRALANATIPTNLLAGPYTLTIDSSNVTPISTTSVPGKNLTQVLVSVPLNGRSQVLTVQGALVTTTTTTSTTSKTRSSSSSLSSTSTTAKTTSTTSAPTLSTTTTSSSSTASSTLTSSQPTSTTSQSSTSTASASGGGIPEFQGQTLVVTIFSLATVALYVLVRGRTARARRSTGTALLRSNTEGSLSP